jgi:hypothetical protein
VTPRFPIHAHPRDAGYRPGGPLAGRGSKLTTGLDDRRSPGGGPRPDDGPAAPSEHAAHFRVSLRRTAATLAAAILGLAAIIILGLVL